MTMSHRGGTADKREMLDQHRRGIHEQFSQILSETGSNKTSEPDAPIFAITTKSKTSTCDPLYPTLPESTTIDHVERMSSNLSFPSRVRKQKRDDEDERLPSIFKQIHINLPFLEAMIRMPKGAKVLKDLLSYMKKLVKAASSVKLSEEYSAIIQRSLPQKEGDPGSFTLPCLIGPLAVKNALADLGAKWTKAEDKGDSNEVQEVSFYPRTESVEPLEWKSPENRLNPSSVEPLELELKELPEHLEYAFLQKNNKLSVVISSALSAVKKARLLEVLRNNKGAIAWSIAYIKGIDLSFCTHKILMEDEFKPSVQPQRRVNPNIK
ncbi:hypothetical protein Tco_1490875 [Tanacetum coccineum]